MDWDKLKIFHTVAEATSFTKASTILNLILPLENQEILLKQKIII